ncbi:MAG: Gfo/Idh/MocA family oxidoreductase [Phycisphaerae bacterium]|jgi:predicted dehydrogenase|nr:Gfo/Idh/MocA family oxidoreductase [Phycisphaerae bacterium]
MVPLRTLNRRQLIKASVAGAITLPYIVSPSVIARAGRTPPSDRITLGCIGVGNRGRSVMGGFLGQEACRVTAVCDVNAHQLAIAKRKVNGANRTKSCRTFKDFRELLGRDDIDTVLIAPPDHWHVMIALAAARAGKDIYLEKPIGVSMAEAWALREALRRYQSVFQFGTQQRSDARFRLACELVRNGRIGPLREINVWSPGSNSGGSTELTDPPEWLDYEMWVGPAPISPHTKGRCTNRFERGDGFKIWPFISDYCVGWISGWGVHPLDIAVWGTGEGLSGSFEIEGAGKFPTSGVCDTATDWELTIKYETGVRVNFSGPSGARRWAGRYGRVSGHGTAFEGDDGWLHVNRGRLNANPADLPKSTFAPDAPRLYKSTNHARNFLDCVRTRKETISNIDSALAVDTICQISAIAVQLGRKLKWNAKLQRFENDSTANGMLSRAMRQPWHM